MSYKDEKTFSVALTKELCPICLKEKDGPLVINTRLTKPAAKKVDELNGKVVGMSDTPCEECQKDMKKAFMLVGFVEAKTEDKSNPYRSGNIWGIKKSAAKKMFNSDMLSKGYAFIDVNSADIMGLPNANLKA